MDAFELQLRDAMTRRQAGMQASQDFQMPQGRMVSGHYIPPSLGDAVIQGLRTYTGQKQYEQAGQEIEQIGQKRQQALSQALRQFGQQAMGTPAETLPEGVEGPTRPGVSPNMRGAYSALLEAPDAALRQAGIQGLAQIPQMEMRQAEREEERRFREQQAQAQRDLQLQLQQMRAEAGQQGRGDYFVPVQTSEGIRILNSRTGQLAMPQGTGGQPLMPPAADPALQGRIVTAKEQAEAKVKSTEEAKKAVSKSDVMIQQLDLAEKLLLEGPTESGAGALVDAAGRLIGTTTKGAQLASQLDAISGWLVANVPRMEGPQSNFDVQNYQTMAGMVGDRTRPVKERLAALRKVKELQQKYKEFNQDKVDGLPTQTTNQPNAMPPGFRVIRGQ